MLQCLGILHEDLASLTTALNAVTTHRVNRLRGEAQVTVKIANYTATPLYRVVELMKVEARRFGVRLKGVDLIGLTPQSVLVEAAQYYLSLRDFTPDKLLETSLKKHLPKERNL